jgi:hypothetical protein
MSEYVVEIVEGPDAGMQFALGQGASEIGRDAGVAIELVNDHLVSRRHARLTLRADGVLVEDLGSRNGTFVNGNQIYSPAIVTPGNEITIGVSVLALRQPGPSAAAATRVVPVALTRIQASPPASPSGPAVAPAPPAPAQLAFAQPPAGAGGLAQPERTPDFVPPDVHRGSSADSPLSPLLDKHTKRMARTAPLAIFVIVALIVIIALALR